MVTKKGKKKKGLVGGRKTERKKSGPALKGKIVEDENEVETCFGTSCNFCERDCPVYRVLRNRIFTSRGKNRAVLGMLRGLYEPDERFAEVVYTCNLCGVCDARCALQNTERFLKVREALADAGLTTKEQRKVIQAMRDTGDVYGRAIDVSETFKDYSGGDTPVFIGCQYKDMENEVREVFRVLEKLGIKPFVSRESCCGNIAHLLGSTGDFENIKEAFREVFSHEEFLTICPSCTMVFRQLYGLKAKHVVEFAAENLDKVKDRIKPLDIKVTYHDPCDLGRKLGVVEEPRKILKAIGVEVVEMELNSYFSMCCGAGGGMLITDPGLAEGIGVERVKQAADTGAEVIVTACPTCEMHLYNAALVYRKNMKKEGKPVKMKVKNIWSLMDKAIE